MTNSAKRGFSLAFSDFLDVLARLLASRLLNEVSPAALVFGGRNCEKGICDNGIWLSSATMSCKEYQSHFIPMARRLTRMIAFSSLLNLVLMSFFQCQKGSRPTRSMRSLSMDSISRATCSNRASHDFELYSSATARLASIVLASRQPQLA